MRNIPILVLLLLLIAAPLAGPAAAGNTATLNAVVTSSNQYINADGVDSATITVSVLDNSGTGVKDANVTLGVSSPWSLGDTSGTTGNDGNFSTTFQPTTVSGNATVTVTATDKKNDLTTSASYTQTVVGGDPQKAASLYQPTASVGSLTELTVLITDKNGNPVTSLKKKNAVVFNTSLTADNGFVVTTSSGTSTVSSNGKIKGISIPVNSSGYVEVGFLLSTKVGSNYITITPPSPLPQTLINIQGVADSVPASITQAVTPAGNPPTLTTGTSYFVINYHLLDQWGNPSTSQNLSITVSTGEQMMVRSNAAGNVTISYGPKKSAGLFTITARSEKSPAVAATQTLQFVSGIPSDMILTANPQSIASLDVKPDSKTYVSAKVIDNQGNPAPGQTVSFAIQDVNTTGYVPTAAPYLKGSTGLTTANKAEVTAVTDENGYAIASFTPGAFTVDFNNPGYSLMAEGIVNVSARWGSKTRYIKLSYKNYPYLSVFTSVTPQTVLTNGTVEVSIRVKGDGYALKPKPVDAYLVTDRSGSMGYDTPTRMSQVTNASLAFKDLFDYSVDRLGLFSFGGTTNKFTDYATLDQGLTDKSSQVDSAIRSLSPNGGTPLRYALYKAITAMKTNGNAGSVKALVVISDGDYNYYGDPLARGSQGQDCYWDGYWDRYWHSYYTCDQWDPTDFGTGTWDWYRFTDLPDSQQNMSQYARDNNIRIYTIGYTQDLSTSGQETLRTLATTTNGKYFYALSNSDLVNFYGQIAGALKDTAGVNTNLSLNFPTIDVNGVANSTAKTLEYRYIKDRSTSVVDPSGSIQTINSTDDWNKGQINVSMGTIKVNQQWTVNLTLKVLAAGNIKLLGSNSKVYFQDVNGGIGSSNIPDTYITSLPEGIEKGLATPRLTLSGLEVTTTPDRSTATLAWHVSYENGRDPEVTEQIDVAPVNSEAYSNIGSTTAGSAETSDTYTMNILTLPEGTYNVRVTGYVDDADSSSTQQIMNIVEVARKPVIKIQ